MEAKDLENWREKFGLSREELARTLKTTYATVFRWEKGERAIPPHLEFALKYLEIGLKKTKAA